MPLILQMTRQLSEPPKPPESAGVRLRHYAGTHDIETWLDLRRRAFARQPLGIGAWDVADFEREFLHKPWWRPEVMWLAEADALLMPTKVIGTITLARRGEGPHGKPVVHWLCVLPTYRRRGIGKLLLRTLESAVWQSGGRQVWLETHTAWREALQLYESLGYHPAAE